MGTPQKSAQKRSEAYDCDAGISDPTVLQLDAVDMWEGVDNLFGTVFAVLGAASLVGIITGYRMNEPAWTDNLRAAPDGE